MLLTRTLRSSTFRLALLCVGVFGTAVFALLAYVYGETLSYVRDRSDHAIAAERRLILQGDGSSGRIGVEEEIRRRVAERGFARGIYLLTDPRLVPLAGNLPAWPARLRGAGGWADIAVPAGSWGGSLGASAKNPFRVAYEILPDGSHLLVGQPTSDLEGFVGRIRIAFALSAALILTIAAVAGISVTRRTVGRIEAINATTRDIMRNGLARRIPLRGTRDEWDQLSANLNAMLDRIEALVQEVRQVSDNVAHDLRTPLTRLQGRLEKAFHHESSSGPHHDLIGETIADLKSILSMFASLLRISRIESLDPKGAFRVVDLGAIAGEVAELFDAAAEEKGGRILFSSQGEVPAWGDRDLLFDAIANILDNAVKHGGPGDVRVEVTAERQEPTISICDHGPGIPAEKRKDVFKRFYRLDQSRSSPGNGLGLSLVAAVVQLHGARIEMEDNGPGLRIRLRFPSVESGSPVTMGCTPDASPLLS